MELGIHRSPSEITPTQASIPFGFGLCSSLPVIAFKALDLKNGHCIVDPAGTILWCNEALEGAVHILPWVVRRRQGERIPCAVFFFLVLFFCGSFTCPYWVWDPGWQLCVLFDRFPFEMPFALSEVQLSFMSHGTTLCPTAYFGWEPGGLIGENVRVLRRPFL